MTLIDSKLNLFNVLVCSSSPSITDIILSTFITGSGASHLKNIAVKCDHLLKTVFESAITKRLGTLFHESGLISVAPA